VFNTGATVAPGFGVGTLATAGSATLNGTLQAEINGTAHDQLNSLGNLALGASSVLNLPAGNTYDGASAVILAAYTGTRTGTFGTTSPLPAGYTLDYGDGSNSFIVLRPANPTNEWFRTDGGAWHTAGNWLTGVVPNGNTATARLGTAMLTDGTIDLAGTNTTVKTLRFNNGAASYTVGASGGGRLTLAADAGNASIVFEDGNTRDHFVSAGLTLAANVDINAGGEVLALSGQQNWGGRSVNVLSGTVRYAPTAASSNTAGASLTISAPATVELAGTASSTSDGVNHVNVTNNGVFSVATGNQAVGTLNGAGSTTVADAATLTATHVRQSSLTIGAGGKVTTRLGGTTSSLASLSLAGTPAAPTATLDLTNSALVVDYPVAGPSPDATIREQIISGRGGSGLGKTWNGPGITSSQAAADPVNSMSVGYAVNGTLPLGPYADFRGIPVDNSSVLMRYTRTGDANLNGVVDNNDVTIVGANFAPGFEKPRWDLGDFDYNGFVDNNDVTLLGVYYNPGATPIPAPADSAGVAAVPEPSTLAMLLLGVLALVFLVPKFRLWTGAR
jgi:hypothetical protein